MADEHQETGVSEPVAKRPLLARVPLGSLLFLLLLVSGIVPLAISSLLLIGQNREILETEQKGYLTRSARALSLELDARLTATRKSLEQFGMAVLSAPPEGAAGEKLREEWITEYASRLLRSFPDLEILRVLDAGGAGPSFAPAALGLEVLESLDAGYRDASEQVRPAYRFLTDERSGVPVVVLTTPVTLDGTPETSLYVQTAVRLRSVEELFQNEVVAGGAEVFLVDRDGKVLWRGLASRSSAAAVEQSALVKDFVATPLNRTQEYEVSLNGRPQKMLGRVSPVLETGWGIVIQRSAQGAFTAVREMIVRTAVSTAVLVALALLSAALAARAVSRPIQRLAESTHHIAAGEFGERVPTGGVGRELADLAHDFNLMGETVENYVGQLQTAAEENQELFIGSIRAFAATIDAKDPYTRGHSERVATYSRAIATSLGMSDEFCYRIWIGALLHDVGKIGVSDRILQKGGVLSNEEFEEMKRHPAIGSEIMSRIEQLRDVIPAIRWHHEAWNGKGYPDGLRGEAIPVVARVVAVADTFDAITTNRPYQQAYDVEFALKTLGKLAGTQFDAKVVTAFLHAFEKGEIRCLSTESGPGTTESTGVDIAVH